MQKINKKQLVLSIHFKKNNENTYPFMANIFIKRKNENTKNIIQHPFNKKKPILNIIYLNVIQR